MQKQQEIAALLRNRKLTRDGADWLTLALDPFHDYEHQVAGYPDADCSQTVVSCYQYQADVSRPANTPNGGTWSAHIYNLPLSVGDNYGVFNMDANWMTLQEPNPVINNRKTGCLNIDTAPSGDSVGVVVPVNNNAVQQILPGVLVDTLGKGITRVIGMGFEVCNTTSELNRQGAVTVYRMPQLGNQYQMADKNNANTFVAPVNGTMWREPPSNLAQMNLLKGTKTWAAEKGVYAPCYQNSVHNPLAQMESTQTLFSPNSAPGAASIARASYWTAAAAAVAPNASAVSFQAGHSIPFDTTGAFFTGLSYETTLTVKLRVYVERAPTWFDTDLSVLASPSAGYDIHALQLYAAVVKTMPVAAELDANALGDWWKAICRVVRTVAAPLGMALNPVLPGAGLVGSVVAAASNAAANAVKNDRRRRKGG